MSLGETIAKLRKEKSISQRELARRINKSGQMISKIENNISQPSMDTLTKISEALEVSMDELFNVNITFSKRLLDALELPILKFYGVGDTLEILSNELTIDYDLLEECSMGSDEELPIEYQVKLLEYLSQIDYATFLAFTETYKSIIQKSDKLKKSVMQILAIRMRNDSEDSLKLLKTYILNVFGEEARRLLDGKNLPKLQEEINKFLEFKLFEMEKKYYHEE